MEKANEITANVTIDLSGTTCPGPMLSAKRLSDDLEDGQVILLISDCPGTGDDLAAWAKHTEHQLLKIDDLGNGKYGYYLRKGDPWKVNVVIDVVGSPCPGPVVAAARLLHSLEDGEVIKIISDCEGSLADMNSWAKSTEHTLLSTTKDARNIYSFYIKK